MRLINVWSCRFKPCGETWKSGRLLRRLWLNWQNTARADTAALVAMELDANKKKLLPQFRNYAGIIKIKVNEPRVIKVVQMEKVIHYPFASRHR